MDMHAATAHLDLRSLASRGAEPRTGADRLERASERQLTQMRSAYAASGGLASGTEMALRLRARCDQPLSKLARWIVERRIVCLHHHEDILIPLFQFEPRSLTPTPAVSAVLRELDGAFDAWDTAAWFAQPSPWLGDARPVDAIDREPQAVLEAARVDRYIVRG